MSILTQDLRHAVRALLKHPGYLATAVLALSLGIGFSTATFSVVHAVLLRPLPYPNPGQLLVLSRAAPDGAPRVLVSPGLYLTWRERTTTMQGIAAWNQRLVNLDTGGGEPERVRADRVSANLFPLLGVSPLTGRGFTGADDAEGAEPVAILSYGAWQRRFGGAAAIGRTVSVDRRPFTIVGIMPPDFAFPAPDVELWTPLAMTAQERGTYGGHYLQAMGRMKPDVRVDEARADLAAAAKWLEQTVPGGQTSGVDVLAFPMHEFSVRSVRTALLLLFGAVAVVLLIACVNVANLLLARGAARNRELAIRAAIGAGRVRLIRQLLVEQVALATVSAGAGVLLAAWLLRALLALVPGALPRQENIGLDGQVLGFALLLAVCTPLVFGLLPAVQASRPDLRGLLAGGGRQGAGGAGRRLRTGLVIAEVALAMVLLVAAGLLIRSFARLADVSPGFDPQRGIVASVNPPPDRYAQGEPREQFYGALLQRVGGLPQVAAVGLSQSIPMIDDFVTWYRVEGDPPPADGNNPPTNFYAVSPGYFEAMGIPLKRGRLFTEGDRRGAARVVIINELLARRQFGDGDPIGRRVMVAQGPSDLREIVGVVGDVKQGGLSGRSSAQVYEPYGQHPYLSGFSLVIRTGASDPAAVVPDVRSIVRSLDADVPLSRVRTLDDIVGASIRPQRFSAVLIALFGAAALLLAAVGVSGVIAYTVGQRRQEFAIRVAHGASRSDILRLVLSGVARMAAAGVGAGLVSAWLLRPAVESLLFGVEAGDAPTYIGVGALLTAVALVASAVPAHRATRVDPMVALRGD